MKILILNHSDNVGGAARAAYRLHMLFKQKFANSEMFVRVKKVIAQVYLPQRAFILFYQRYDTHLASLF